MKNGLYVILIILLISFVNLSSDDLTSIDGLAEFNSGNYEEALIKFKADDSPSIDNNLYQIEAHIFLNQQEIAVDILDSLDISISWESSQKLEYAKLLFWQGKYIKQQLRNNSSDLAAIERKITGKQSINDAINDKFESAHAIITELINNNAIDLYGLYIMQGIIYQEQSYGKWSTDFGKEMQLQAETFFDKAKPLSSSLYEFYLAISLEKNRFEEFIDGDDFETALENNPIFTGDFSVLEFPYSDFNLTRVFKGLIYRHRRWLNLGKAIHFDNTAISYLSRKKLTEALQRINKTIELNPVIDKFHYHKSIIEFYMKDYEASLLSINEAIHQREIYYKESSSQFRTMRLRILDKLHLSIEVKKELNVIENFDEYAYVYWGDWHYHFSKYYSENENVQDAVKLISVKMNDIDLEDSYNSFYFIVRSHYYLLAEDYDKALNDLKLATKGDIYSSSIEFTFIQTEINQIFALISESEFEGRYKYLGLLDEFNREMNIERLDLVFDLNRANTAYKYNDYEYILEDRTAITGFVLLDLINHDMLFEIFLLNGLALHETGEYEKAALEFEAGKESLIQDSLVIDNGIFKLLELRSLFATENYETAIADLNSIEPNELWCNMSYYIFSELLFYNNDLEKSLTILKNGMNNGSKDLDTFNEKLEKEGSMSMFLTIRDYEDLFAKNLKIDNTLSKSDIFVEPGIPYPEFYLLKSAIHIAAGQEDEAMKEIQLLLKAGMKKNEINSTIHKLLIKAGYKREYKDYTGK